MTIESLLRPHRPASGRKAFRRSQVPLAERIASIVVVCLLAGIGAIVWVQGRLFHPGLYSLSESSLASTKAEVSVPATARHSRAPADSSAPTVEPSEDGYAEAPREVTVATVPKNALEIPGAIPMGDTEFYSPETLYEKINGRAPAYLDFGFQQLRCRSFVLPDGSFADVYEYRMDSPVNAFGIFAMERDPAGQPVDFAADGYSGEMGYFFRRGDRYVQVIASDQKLATVALAKTVSEHLARTIPANDAGLDARKRLPSAGMLSESVTYLQENALGHGFLRDVFQANYQVNGKTLTFFLMVTTPEAATKAWDEFLAFSSRFGGQAEVLPDISGARIFRAQNFGKGKLVYQRGGEVGGVIDVVDPAAARAFLEAVLDGKKPPEPPR